MKSIRINLCSKIIESLHNFCIENSLELPIERPLPLDTFIKAKGSGAAQRKILVTPLCIGILNEHPRVKMRRTKEQARVAIDSQHRL